MFKCVTFTCSSVKNRIDKKRFKETENRMCWFSTLPIQHWRLMLSNHTLSVGCDDDTVRSYFFFVFSHALLICANNKTIYKK